MSKTSIYQIFYDQETRKNLDAGFIPLDNSRNERPDWYEFWVIRNYLLQNKLDEDRWYGFLPIGIRPSRKRKVQGAGGGYKWKLAGI